MKFKPSVILALVILLAYYLIHGVLNGQGLPTPTPAPRVSLAGILVPADAILVEWDGPAINSCTIYEQQVEIPVGDPLRVNFPEGKYAPRHCWMVGPTVRSYVDDWDFIRPEQTAWDVYAAVDFVDSDGQIRTRTSNRIRVIR